MNHETLNVLKYVRPGGGFVPKFPVFGKVEVNGLNEEPLFAYLKVVCFMYMIWIYAINGCSCFALKNSDTLSFLIRHRKLCHLWTLLLEIWRNSTGPQSMSMTFGGILRSSLLLQMACPSEGEVIDHRPQVRNPISSPLGLTSVTIKVALMLSLYCRYELHCPIENVEKDIAELLWWILFNLSPVAEWRSPSKCTRAPELDLMGRGTSLRASVHSLWGQVPFSHWRSFHCHTSV